MNFKRFTLLSLVSIFALVGVIQLNSSVEEKYFPRETTYFQLKEQMLEGSREFLSTIKYNRSTGSISYEEVAAAAKAANKLRKGNKALDINWRFKGPDNVGGRVRAIIVDRNDTSHIITGGVSGGIWESFDGAVTWSPYDPEFKISHVSSMAQGSDGTIYVGTGSEFDGDNNNKAKGSHFLGTGLFKLTGNGTSELLAGPNAENTFGAAWSYINEIATDPNDPERLLVATGQGLRESTDGGENWSTLLPVGSCHDVEMIDDVIVATFPGRVEVSTDGGATFTSTTLPGSRRIEAAIAPSNSNIIYLSATRNNNCLFGVYRTIDAGQNWEEIKNTPDYFGAGRSVGACQGFYDNEIIVYPNNPGKIIVGGVDLLQWNQSSVDPAPVEGGWRSIANQFQFIGNPFYVHADKHKFVFNPENPNTLYLGTDGGISVSFNANAQSMNYSTSNLGLNITQFYDIGVGPNDQVIGGTQDNGTLLTGFNTLNTGRNGIPVSGGDGFDAHLFTINPELGITSLYYGIFNRLQGVGTSFGTSIIDLADVTSGSLQRLCENRQCAPGVFYTSIGKWESFRHEGTKDSVLLQFTRTELPPIPMGTFLDYESKNNDWPLTDSLRTDLFPTDTLSGNIDTNTIAIDSIGRHLFDVAYEPIIVDTALGKIIFNFRNQPVDSVDYTVGVPVNWTSVFTPSDPLFITVTNSEIIYNEFQITFFYEVEFADSVQSMVNIANVRGVSNASDRDVWMSKDLLKGGSVNVPRWFKITGAGATPTQLTPGSDVVISNEFTPDGNHLFLGTRSGNLYRVDNLNDIDVSAIPISASDNFVINNITSTRRIGNFGNRAVTGIAIDPNDANKIIVTLGNYGNTDYIRRSTNALSNFVTFDFIDGFGDNELPNTPIYDAIIDRKDSNKVLIGTEFGVFATENAFDTTTIFDSALNFRVLDVRWTEENAGLGRAPVMSMQQMTFGEEWGTINEGKVYIGTHGRGIFESDQLVGLENITQEKESSKVKKSSIHVYPNPVRDYTRFDYEVQDVSSDVNIQLYSISGQLVLNESPTNIVKGKNSTKLDLSDLKNGTYIIRLLVDNKVSSGKIIKH